MKRLLALAAALLIAAALILPFGFGVLTERTYRALAGTPRGTEELTLSGLRFERGWFTSRATMELSLAGSLLSSERTRLESIGAAPPEVLRFTLDDTIHHGPFPLAALLRGHFPLRPVRAVVSTAIAPDAPTQAFLERLVGTGGPLTSARRVLLDGSHEARLSDPDGRFTLRLPAPAPNLQAPPLLTIEWRDLEASVTFSPGSGRTAFGLSAGEIRLPGGQGGLVLERLRLRSDSVPAARGIWAGRSLIEVTSVKLQGAGGDAPAFSLRDLSLSGSSEPTGDTQRFREEIRAREIGAAGRRVGPGSLVFEVRNLDTAALAEMQRVTRESAGQDRERPNALTRSLAASALALARRSPEAEIPLFSLRTEEGEIEGSAKLHLAGGCAGAPPDLATLAKCAEAEAEVRLPQRFLQGLLKDEMKQRLSGGARGGARAPDAAAIDRLADIGAQQQVQALLAMSYLVQDGDRYKLAFRYAEGAATLNGLPFPPSRRRR